MDLSKSLKIPKVMDEYKANTLQTKAGKKVENKKQALAIAFSEARRNKGKGLLK
jgi:hypothetical protein